MLNGEQGVLMYATSRNGRPFATPIRVPTMGSPKPSHPQIAAAADGRILIAWDEVIGGIRTAGAREVSIRRGRAEFSGLTKFAEGTSTYPVVAPTSRGWLAVWSTGGATALIRATILN